MSKYAYHVKTPCFASFSFLDGLFDFALFNVSGFTPIRKLVSVSFALQEKKK